MSGECRQTVRLEEKKDIFLSTSERSTSLLISTSDL